MPRITDLQQHNVSGSTYGFSATRLGDLGASAYTLVAIAADTSGSVYAFKDDIEAAIGAVVQACQRSPRADNLMLRVLAFDDSVQEVHGFKPLSECPPKAYSGCLDAGGMTALYDAAQNAVASVTAYGHSLTHGGFSANGLVFVITDGGDNTSTLTAASVKVALDAAITGEHLESMLAVLIGVNVQDMGLSATLGDFSKTAGFDGYVELQDANPATLARLATFFSRSIALQSRALGSGQLASLRY